MGNLEGRNFHHVQLLLAVHGLTVWNKVGISTLGPWHPQDSGVQSSLLLFKMPRKRSVFLKKSVIT